MSTVRSRLLAHLERCPGAHVSALVRDLDLAPGQVQYHLDHLRDADRVVAERYRGRTHHFPEEYDACERRAIAVLCRETARDVVAYLLQSGPTSPGVVADDLDIARSTLEYHLEALTTESLVEKRRDDTGQVTLIVPDPAATLSVLAAARPGTVDRFHDRFTRLVDALLEGN